MSTLPDILLANALFVTVAAPLVWLVTRSCRRPALAHALWLLVLLKLVTPPVYPVELPHLDLVSFDLSRGELPERELPPISAAVEPELAFVVEAGPVPEAPEWIAAPLGPVESRAGPARQEPRGVWLGALRDPRFLLLALWAGGSLFVLLLALRGVLRFRRLLAYTRPADPQLQRDACELAKRFPLARLPRVEVVPARISPMLWAFGCRARLLLPESLLSRLDRRQMDAVLAHELAHLHRRDHWVRAVELLALVLFWWHPVAWWARGALREAEEECCDAWVVAVLPACERLYAEVLLDVVDFLSADRLALPAGASGIGHVRSLKRRLTMIMQRSTIRRLTARGKLAVLALAAAALPILPTGAQDEPKPVRTQGLEKAETPAAVQEARKRLEALERRAAEHEKRGEQEAAQKVRHEHEALQKRVEHYRTRMPLLKARAADTAEVTKRGEGHPPAHGADAKQHVVHVRDRLDRLVETIETLQERKSPEQVERLERRVRELREQVRRLEADLQSDAGRRDRRRVEAEPRGLRSVPRSGSRSVPRAVQERREAPEHREMRERAPRARSPRSDRQDDVMGAIERGIRALDEAGKREAADALRAAREALQARQVASVDERSALQNVAERFKSEALRAKEEAHRMAQRAKDEAKHMAEVARREAAKMAEVAKREAAQMAEAAKREAGRARAEAERMAETAMHEAARVREQAERMAVRARREAERHAQELERGIRARLEKNDRPGGDRLEGLERQLQQMNEMIEKLSKELEALKR